MLKGLKSNVTLFLIRKCDGYKKKKNHPDSIKKFLAENDIKFYIINASKIADEIGLPGRTNTIMQSAFFKVAEVIPYDLAVKAMKKAIEKTYGKKGEKVVQLNYAAVDAGSQVIKVDIPVDWKNISIKEDQKDSNLPDFIKNVVIGTFEKQTIDLTELNFPIRFKIISVEIIPPPDFYDEMNFKMMTPLILSTTREHNGKISQYFLRPDDIDDINRVLTKNLQNKFGALYNREIIENVFLSWDKDYLNRTKRITKKITINQHGKFPIDVIGLNAPFSLSGNVDLIKVGYECGFGEKNSMGFGMAEVINDH
jgi:CRISPR-associated endoribonuclease Cas6